MPLNPDSIEVVLFDSYGTIVDVDAVEEPLSKYTNDAETVAKLWRERSLAYAMVSNAIEEYDTFFEMNRRALQYALNIVGVELDDNEQEDVLSTYHQLPAFDDVTDGLQRLNDAGYDCYVVSNGNEEMLESMVEEAAISEYIIDTISADEIERFKPNVELYQYALEQIGIKPENTAYVAGGWWDVPGGINAGMQGVWINRQDTLWGPYDTEPALTIDTFHELADALEA